MTFVCVPSQHYALKNSLPQLSCTTSGKYFEWSLAIFFVGKCEMFILHMSASHPSCVFTTINYEVSLVSFAQGAAMIDKTRWKFIYWTFIGQIVPVVLNPWGLTL